MRRGFVPEHFNINGTDVATAPALNLTNLHYEVFIAPTNRSHFYRLKH